MTETKQSNVGYYCKLTLTLFLITAVVAALLGIVNLVTSERIDARKAEKTAAAMQEVCPAERYVTGVSDSTEAASVYIAKTGTETVGYVIEVLAAGFGGSIDMVVGVDLNGCVTGVSIISMSETPALGDNAKKPAFRAQFIGKTGTLAVTKDGGSIDALTGATVTSRAVTRGVNAAIVAAQTAREAE